jgi:hypothetical protein
MNRARLLLSLSFLGASLLGACSSSDSSSGNASDASAFVSSLASIVCDAYAPCCAQKGLPADGAQCRAFYTVFGSAQKGTYDPAAGQACLDAVRAASQSASVCDTAASSDTSDAICNNVFKSATTGTKNPGETCDEDGDCIASAEGKVSCQTQFTGTAETKTCLLQIVGKEGDSPCVATIDGNSTSFSFSSDGKTPAKGYSCNKKDNLHCDSSSQKCIAYADVGGKCTFSGDCLPASYCNSGVCAARLAVGADCGTSSFDDSCTADAYCDKMKCTARLADASACTSSNQCQSNQCVNMKCAAKSASDFSSAFLCGGS